FSLLGTPEALSIPEAFFNKTAAGGVLVIKVKDLSAYTVITTGIIIPACSLVFSLNSLQKPMIFTPCCPNAGPTGGAGVAFPAGICNFINPTTFFAIFLCTSLFNCNKAFLYY